MNTKKYISVAIVLVLVLPLVIATQGTVTKIPIRSCKANADLFVYQGSQWQEEDTSFLTSRDELLIFTKSNRVSDVKVNGVAPEVIYDQYDPFRVKVYRTDTTPGVVHMDVTSNQGARGVQAYVAQDKGNRLYPVSSMPIVYDGEEVNQVYLNPGTYQYVFFDKYDLHTDGSDDSRELTVTVKGDSGIVSQHTYTKPFPTGIQGTVVHSFTIPEAGNYNVSVHTDDSLWWVLYDCEPSNDVPEFGIIAAAVLVGLAGFFIYKKRK